MEIEPEMGSIVAFADVVSTSRGGKEAAQTTVTSLVSNCSGTLQTGTTCIARV